MHKFLSEDGQKAFEGTSVEDVIADLEEMETHGHWRKRPVWVSRLVDGNWDGHPVTVPTAVDCAHRYVIDGLREHLLCARATLGAVLAEGNG